MKLKIYYSNEQEIMPVGTDLKALITKAVCTVIESEKYINNIVMSAYEKDGELSITFTDNAHIREVNLNTRNIDSETDVLSFPMFEDVVDLCKDVSFGDILLSLEKAKEQADTFGHSYEREVIFLVVHSMLHLLGYDHMEEAEDEEMRKKQREIMKKLHLEVN